MSIFAERLKQLRKKAGLSQAELGKAAGFTQKAISYWETGAREPGWEAVVKIAAALGVTPDAFIVESPPDPEPEDSPPLTLLVPA